MAIFKFEKDEIMSHIRFDLQLLERIKEPLKYIFKTMKDKGHSLTLKNLDGKIDLKKAKQHKGKNYNWSVITYKNAQLLIRQYGENFTIFTKVTKPSPYDKGKTITEFGAFTFHTELNFLKLTDNQHDKLMDKFYTNCFLELNQYVKSLFEVLIERGVYWVWNSACWKVPEHNVISLAFEKENIHSLDKFVFCFEEIDSFNCQLFAENDMFTKLSELKVGDKFGEDSKIKSINKTLKDNYFHGVGVTVVDKKGKTDFHDVYRLTRWYYKEVYKIKETS